MHIVTTLLVFALSVTASPLVRRSSDVHSMTISSTGDLQSINGADKTSGTELGLIHRRRTVKKDVARSSILDYFCQQCDQSQPAAMQNLCQQIIDSNNLPPIQLSSERRRSESAQSKCVHPGLDAHRRRATITAGAEFVPEESQSCQCLSRLVTACNSDDRTSDNKMYCMHNVLCECPGVCEDFRYSNLGCEKSLIQEDSNSHGASLMQKRRMESRENSSLDASLDVSLGAKCPV